MNLELHFFVLLVSDKNEKANVSSQNSIDNKITKRKIQEIYRQLESFEQNE